MRHIFFSVKVNGYNLSGKKSGPLRTTKIPYAYRLCLEPWWRIIAVTEEISFYLWMWVVESEFVVQGKRCHFSFSPDILGIEVKQVQSSFNTTFSEWLNLIYSFLVSLILTGDAHINWDIDSQINLFQTAGNLLWWFRICSHSHLSLFQLPQPLHMIVQDTLRPPLPPSPLPNLFINHAVAVVLRTLDTSKW